MPRNSDCIHDANGLRHRADIVDAEDVRTPENSSNTARDRAGVAFRGWYSEDVSDDCFTRDRK